MDLFIGCLISYQMASLGVFSPFHFESVLVFDIQIVIVFDSTECILCLSFDWDLYLHSIILKYFVSSYNTLFVD